MDLNVEQITQALERCLTLPPNVACKGCMLSYEDEPRMDCLEILMKNALALIKELTEENEYLKQQNEIYEVLNKKLENACESYAWQYGTAVSKELFLKKERENTVREMQKRLTDRDEFSLRADYDGIYYIDHACWVNQVAAEILGEE